MLLDRNGPVDPSTLDPALPACTLYGNQVTVQFDPIAHRYFVKDREINGGLSFSPFSVTRVLGLIDKSEPLTAWTARCAHEKFLGLVRPGQIYTLEEIERIGWTIRTAHKIAVDRACEIGHGVHEWIQMYLLARAGLNDYPLPPTDPPIRSACSAARKWILDVDLKPVSIERILYSRKHRVIGITDVAGAVANVSGELSAIDWKSSNSIEGHTYEWQLAAYAKMFSEMTGQEVRQRWLVRLDKENSTAYPKQLSAVELDQDWTAFLGLLAAKTRLVEMEVVGK